MRVFVILCFGLLRVKFCCSVLFAMSMLTNKYAKNFSDTHYINIQVPKSRSYEKSESLKSVKRGLKLFILCFLLPLIFLIYPLYLKHRVYIQQIYPIGVSDMIIIDNKISTTWCQRQLISSNTTFNAYVMANEPQIIRKTEDIYIRRPMVLKDGAKEYWGFYLLKGSSFTISSCVRWPGASLIVIEGHKNLKECAYVGDNSSEETEDSLSSDEDRNSTLFSLMTKIQPGVALNFKWPYKAPNSTNKTSNEYIIESDVYGKTRNIHLKYAENLYLEEHRNKTNTVIQPNSEYPKSMDSAEVLADVLNRLRKLGPKGKMVLQKLQNKTSDLSQEILNQLDQIIVDLSDKTNLSKKGRKINNNRTDFTIESTEFNNLRKQIMAHRLKLDLDNETNTGQEVFDDDNRPDIHGSFKNVKNGDRSKSEYWSSFSSSEERLLQCRGLLVSLPLIPEHTCNQSADKSHLDELGAVNAVSYTVRSDGYYFFIFNNENEVVDNFIHAHFKISKTVYNTTGAVVSCKNQTCECSLPLTFWSRERTILELPYPANDTLWNEEYIFSTTCEPRSVLYIICIATVPISILLFAFS